MPAAAVQKPTTFYNYIQIEHHNESKPQIQMIQPVQEVMPQKADTFKMLVPPNQQQEDTLPDESEDEYDNEIEPMVAPRPRNIDNRVQFK